MGVSEGFMIGQIDQRAANIQQEVSGVHQSLHTLNDNMGKHANRIEEKVNALLEGQFIPLSQHNQMVEKHNKLVKAFQDTRLRELGVHQVREGAYIMIKELTGEDRDEIHRKARDEYSDLPEAVKITKEYAEKRIKDDKEMGIY